MDSIWLFAKHCLPFLGNTSTLNDRFIFACHTRIVFAFRYKPGFISLITQFVRIIKIRLRCRQLSRVCHCNLLFTVLTHLVFGLTTLLQLCVRMYRLNYISRQTIVSPADMNTYSHNTVLSLRLCVCLYTICSFTFFWHLCIFANISFETTCAKHCIACDSCAHIFTEKYNLANNYNFYPKVTSLVNDSG